MASPPPHLTWQQLKTGFSERSTLSHQNLAESSSSLAFAIASHNSSGPQGHSIFIDLRNREDERVEEKDQQDKGQQEAEEKRRQRKADKDSDAKLEELNNGRVVRQLTKWSKAIKVRFNLLVSGERAMKERRTQIVEEQEKQKKADQEKKDLEGTKERRRARLNAQVREREQARLQKSDPAELIQKVKDMWVQHCNTITSNELGKDKGNEDTRLLREDIQELVLDTLATGSRACDVFDVCAVSFFRNVLLPPATFPWILLRNPCMHSCFQLCRNSTQTF